MSTEKITERLTKVVLGMIANDRCGVLPLSELLRSTPALQTNDLEQLYSGCKAASEVAMLLSQSFTRSVTISFEQHERFTGSSYVPDCEFIINWAS